MNSKAQVGSEYLLISGFLLFAVIVFFAYSLTSYYSAVSFSKAKNVVDSCANLSSQLAGLGNGSSLTVDLDFPEDIQSFQVSGKTFRLFVSEGALAKEYFAESKLDLNSVSLPLTSGFHTVKAVLNQGKVDFTGVS